MKLTIPIIRAPQSLSPKKFTQGHPSIFMDYYQSEIKGAFFSFFHKKQALF